MVNKLKIPKDWEEIKVSKAFEFIPTTSHSKGEINYKEGDNSSIYNIHYGDIHAKYSIYVDFEKDKIPHLKDAKNGFDRNLLKSGDLVMVDASEDLEGVGTCIEIKNLNNKKCVAGLHTFALRDSKKHTVPGYRGLMLKHKAVKHRMQQVSTYSKVFGMSKKSFSDIDLTLPPLPEQEKIVEVLETWDEYLEKLAKTIKATKEVKKSLVQKLLTGKLRLSGFGKEWEIRPLAFYIEPKLRPVTKPESSFLALGIRSHCKGIFQKPSFDPKKIAMETLYEVTKDDLIMNITFAWEGAIAIAKAQDEGGLVSHRFPTHVFKKNIGNVDFFRQFIQTKKFRHLLKLISPGGAGRNRVMSKKDFLKLKIQVPDYEEQTAIANILTTADQEIEALEKKRAIIEAQKKFLLNNLVTGQIRLPEFTNAN